MGFKDTFIRSIKPLERRQTFSEGNGFYLYVQPTGRKFFYYVFKRSGKRQQIRLGEYPHLKLADARRQATDLHSRRLSGEDILKPKGLTVDGLAEQYLTEHSRTHNVPGTYIANRRMLERDVLPCAIPVDSIGRADIQSWLSRLRREDKATTHNHLLTVVKRMLNFAVEQGHIEYNPAQGIKRLPTSTRTRVLTDEEIRQVMSGPDSSPANILKLTLLTGARPGETLNLSYEDINGRWWSCKQIKGQRKNGFRRTYLSCEARKIIGEGSGRVFTTNDYSGLFIHGKRRGYEFKPHDLRRTAATRLAGMGYADEMIHRYLGHSMQILSRTYNLHQYSHELREMAVVWAWEIRRVCVSPELSRNP